MTYTKDTPAFIRHLYEKNMFISDFFDIKIDEIHCGGATVSLKIDHQKHLNHRGVVQSGALAALTDAVSEITGASVGAKVDTLSFSMNFIKGIKATKAVSVVSEIRHHGRTTMVITAEMYNENKNLMATSLITLSVEGIFDEIPKKW